MGWLVMTVAHISARFFAAICWNRFRVDVTHLSLYNLSVIHKKKYFDSEMHLMTYINDNWELFQLGEVRTTLKDWMLRQMSHSCVFIFLFLAVCVCSYLILQDQSDLKMFWRPWTTTATCGLLFSYSVLPAIGHSCWTECVCLLLQWCYLFFQVYVRKGGKEKEALVWIKDPASPCSSQFQWAS